MITQDLPSKLSNKLAGKLLNKQVESSYQDLDAKSKKPFMIQKPSGFSSLGYVNGEVQLYAVGTKRKRWKGVREQRRSKDLRTLNRIRRSYLIPNPENVLTFLNQYQDLVSFLIDAYVEIRKYFPNEALSLEVVSDSEAASSRELFVYILTSLPVKKALKKLDELDDQWFLEQLDRTNNLLNFNLRFV